MSTTNVHQAEATTMASASKSGSATRYRKKSLGQSNAALERTYIRPNGPYHNIPMHLASSGGPRTAAGSKRKKRMSSTI